MVRGEGHCGHPQPADISHLSNAFCEFQLKTETKLCYSHTLMAVIIAKLIMPMIIHSPKASDHHGHFLSNFVYCVKIISSIEAK